MAEWTGRVCALANGMVSPSDKVLKRYVGVPGMSTIARHLLFKTFS
jgi:hypothetical protein